MTSSTAGWWRAQSCCTRRVHPDAGERVERAERLVEQQQLGLADERPGERGPLRLAARQRLGPVVLVAVEPDLGERRAARAAAASRPRRPSMTLSSTAAHGSSRGSWNTTDAGARARGSRPSTPRSSPARARSSVLLPEPLRPSRATNSPGRRSRSMPAEHLAVAERPADVAGRRPRGRGRRRVGRGPRSTALIGPAASGAGAARGTRTPPSVERARAPRR